MPSRNTTKYYDVPAFYHVYNRGAGEQQIFLDDADKQKFISLLVRHLDPNDTSVRGDTNMPYEKYELELVAYCLMGNHFHLLVYQDTDREAITKLMRSVSTAYTMYFNKKYKRHGHLFQSIFKASRILNEGYLEHITRYIHLNPRSYKTYQWSSIGSYLGKWSAAWIHPQRVLTMTPEQYKVFLEDYESTKAMLDEIKRELAV